MVCSIWHHLNNLEKVKNTHGGVLLLETLPHGWFSSTRFFYKNIEIGESHALFLTSILRLKMFLTCSYFLAFQKPLFFQLLRKG